MSNNITIAIVLGLASSLTLAQSSFQGFYGQVATGYEVNNASSLNGIVAVSPGGVDNTNQLLASNQSFAGLPLVLGLGYNFSVSPKWLLGLGVDYSALSNNSSSYSYTNQGTSTPDGALLNGAQLKVSNRFNLFITPGYSIDRDKLIYAKAGYSSVKIEAQAPTSYSIPGYANIPLGTKFPQNQTSTLSGFMLGLGYKQMIGSGIYGFAEANYMSYGNATVTQTGSSGSTRPTTNLSSAISLNSYQFLLGLGYKF